MRWYIAESRAAEWGGWIIVDAEGYIVLGDEISEAAARKLVRLHNQELSKMRPAYEASL